MRLRPQSHPGTHVQRPQVGHGGLILRWLIIVSIMPVICGCSVNQYPLLGCVRYLRNDADTGRAVHIEAWGLHLTTETIDAGIHLGHVQQTFFFAGAASDDDGQPLAQFVVRNNETLLKPVSEEEGRSWQLKPALALRSQKEGVSLGLASGIRLQLGLSQQAAIQLPRDSHLIIIQRQSGVIGQLDHAHFTVHFTHP